jgi:RNA polymerase sigma-70 factor (ECF subfamily)
MDDAEAEQIRHLLARARGNDTHAVKALYARCSVVYPHVLRLHGDAALAREVHHDTVTALWKGGAEFRGESSFSTWVIAIARNLAADLLRQRSREASRTVVLDTLDADHTDGLLQASGAAPADDDADPAQGLWLRQLREGVQGCMAKLSRAQGECLMLVYYAQMSQSEIAQVLGLNVNTVKSRVRVAHENIERCLQRLRGEGDE